MLLFLSVALAAMPSKLPPDKERGKELYHSFCWTCHGKTGQGDGPMASVMDPSPTNLLVDAKKKPFPGQVEIILNGKGTMPAYEQLMDKHDARRILVYLAQLDPEKEEAEAEEGSEEDSDNSTVDKKKEVDVASPSTNAEEKNAPGPSEKAEDAKDIE